MTEWKIPKPHPNWDKPGGDPLEDLKLAFIKLLKEEAKKPMLPRCALCCLEMKRDELRDDYVCHFCHRLINGEKVYIGLKDLDEILKGDPK
jgi:hypothetical protein